MNGIGLSPDDFMIMGYSNDMKIRPYNSHADLCQNTLL